LRGEDRLVLGPCTDGGYYLIGLNCRHDRLLVYLDAPGSRGLDCHQ
jgi:glycosyltransferase A (GT-A) superfamily protein (DUF2064 family)